MLALLLVASSFTGTDPMAIARAEAAFAMIPAAAPAPVKQTVQQVVMHAGVGGHTHVCPNKDCPFRKAYGEPFVWGGQNHSHACAYCNTEQTVTSNRPATFIQTLAAIPASVTPQEASFSLAALQSSAAMSSACANG